MSKLPKFQDARLLVGTETADDAAVYEISKELAIIQTVDFFTPVVDDPYTFGQIAAANALSDIYAMGGEPRLALNVAAFPSCLPPDILGDILAGGADKVMEAGAVLAGGHTIMDDEPKYGLCVTGFVHPKKVWTNNGAKQGDILILTKPLGSGILTTAEKGGMVSEEEIKKAIHTMAYLNKYACEAVQDLRVHGCTDITGFGLAGHAGEMAEGSQKTILIHSGKVPVLDGALTYASMGFVPAGAYRNREYVSAEISRNIQGQPIEDILYDPQTSGGLLISIHPGDVQEAVKRLSTLEIPGTIIGEVIEKQEKSLLLD